MRTLANYGGSMHARNSVAKRTWIGYLVTPALLLASCVAPAQYGQAQYSRDHHHEGNFYNGVRDGGSGGQYYQQDQRGQYDQRYAGRYQNGYQNGYNNNYQRPDDHRGGIGPGKGALIGGAGGAALGAIFGGGLKGALIGGAAGAGIGAIAGKVHQNNQRRSDYRDYNR